MNPGYRVGLATIVLFGMICVGSKAQETGSTGTERAEVTKVGSGSGTFLNMPVGARATGFGASFVGVADDPSALYWNPAGITQMEGSAGSYSFAPLFAGMSQHFAGFIFPIGGQFKGGVHALAYGSDPIGITTMFEQQGTGGTYTVQDLSLGLTLAGQLTEQFSFGATGKYISLKIADLQAGTVAFDFGTMYKPGILGMRIGFAVQNLAPTVTYSGSSLTKTGQIDPNTGNQSPDVAVQAGDATLPLTFRAGLAADIMAPEDADALTVSTEFSTAADRSEYVGLGVEYVYNDLISARVGYQFGTEEAFGLSGGLGLNYDAGSFAGRIDWAIRPHKTLGLSNYITASVRFE